MSRTNCKDCLFADECHITDESCNNLCDYFAPVSDSEGEYIESAREDYRAAWRSYMKSDDECMYDVISRIADKWNSLI